MPRHEPSNYSTPQQIPIQSGHHKSTLTKLADKFLMVRAIIGIVSCIIPCVTFNNNSQQNTEDNDVIIHNYLSVNNSNINDVNDHSVFGDFIEFFVESFQ